MTTAQERTRRSLIGSASTRQQSAAPAPNPLVPIFAEASRAMPYVERDRPGDREPLRINKHAAAVRTLVLKSTPMPALFDREGRMVRQPAGNLAGQTMMLGAAIVNASRTAQAGANIIVMEHIEPQIIESGSDSKNMVFMSSPTHFVTVDPATFAEVADDSDTPETDPPVHVAQVVRDGRSFGVRFKVTRAQQKERGEQLVADELLAAIISGVAQTADLVLLEAIKAATPAAFTLGAAAAAGVRFTDLRALVGTDGAGAHVSASGNLVAWPFNINVQTGGIAAELTPGIAETIVGAFDHAAVVLGPEMTVIAERLNARGDLMVQGWLNIDAAVPDVSKFWTVGA